MLNRLCIVLFSCLLVNSASAQTTVPLRDPNAVALANRALPALVGGTTLSDPTVQASANCLACSNQEMGSATLTALGNQQSRVTLSLTNGQRTEIRSGPAGKWIASDGVSHAMALHNCWASA